MFIKLILKAFDPETALLFFINDRLIEDHFSVESFMNDGLTNYTTVEPGQLTIEENAIVIRIYTN